MIIMLINQSMNLLFVPLFQFSLELATVIDNLINDDRSTIMTSSTDHCIWV